MNRGSENRRLFLRGLVIGFIGALIVTFPFVLFCFPIYPPDEADSTGNDSEVDIDSALVEAAQVATVQFSRLSQVYMHDINEPEALEKLDKAISSGEEALGLWRIIFKRHPQWTGPDNEIEQLEKMLEELKLKRKSMDSNTTK